MNASWPRVLLWAWVVGSALWIGGVLWAQSDDIFPAEDLVETCKELPSAVEAGEFAGPQDTAEACLAELEQRRLEAIAVAFGVPILGFAIGAAAFLVVRGIGIRA